jgi:hypothetical protein
MIAGVAFDFCESRERTQESTNDRSLANRRGTFSVMRETLLL